MRTTLSIVSMGLLIGVAPAQSIVEIPEELREEIQNDFLEGEEHEKKSDFNQSAFYYNKSASTYWAYGHLSPAADLFQKAMLMSEKLGNLNGIYVISTNLGLIHTDLNQYDLALKSFSTATSTARKLERNHDIASSLVNQANVCYEIDSLTEAIDYLNLAHAIAQEISEIKLLRNTYSLFSRIYDKLGQREESAKYFDLFAAVTRKIQQDEMLRKEEEAKNLVSQATTRVLQVESQKQATEQELVERDMELKEKQMFLEQAEKESRERQMQIELLSKERELQQAIIHHQYQMRWVYIGIIISILGIAALIFYFYHEKRKANILLQHKNTEISRQNVEIQAQAQKLRELNQLKDKLFSIISHDLRSPLGSLFTLLNLTKEGYFTEEGFKKVVDELSKNVGYTSALLENLLKWAQSQLHGAKINPTIFKLSQLAEEKLKLYAKQASDKGIVVSNLIDPKVLVFADSDMIELVFRNLIANAIKYSNKGSNVTISASNSNGNVLVCIADTGLGIPPENMGKLFGKEIFTTYGTSHEKGTGLGLILCKDFVSINGGEIWANSTVGKAASSTLQYPSREIVLWKKFCKEYLQNGIATPIIVKKKGDIIATL